MKKVILYTFVLLAVGLALVYAQNTLKNPKKAVIKELAEIYENYGDSFFKSVFSIESIRPYAILQLDKAIDNYDNSNWLSYNSFVEKLSNNERSTLLIKINEYILSQESKENQDKVIVSIKLWCIAEAQLNFIEQKLNFSKTEILVAGKKIISSTNETEFTIDSKDNLDLQFNKLLNYVTKLDNHRQMEFFSAIYHELASENKK